MGISTASEWLTKAEDLWAPRLRQVGLVSELDANERHVKNAAKCLGLTQTQRPNAIETVLATRPSSVVLAFTGVAVHGYQAGSFWPQFWDACGLTNRSADQGMWGQAFLRALSTLGLPTFPNSPKPVLGPLLMHAGIPTYCLPDYFRALTQGMRAVGADADALVSWATDRIDTSLSNIDRPVVRFLQYGGDYAVDFVDRSLDLIVELSAGRDGSEVVLPERILDAARAFVMREQLMPEIKGTVRATRAGLRLDPYSGKLDLVLPALDNIDHIFAWRISADGVQHAVRPAEALGGRRIGSQEATWQVDRPVRVVAVSAGALAKQQEIILFDEKDPALYFDVTGAVLPRHLSLPAGPVWVLFRAPDNAADQSFAGLIRTEEQPPLGWNGWRLALLDLHGQDFVQLASGTPRRSVRVQSKVWIEDGDLVPWIRAGGLPVHVSRPVLHLPDGLTAQWTMKVTDASTGETIVDRILDSHAEFHDVIDAFEGIDSPAVGRFEISVKGPLGRGTTREIALVEGMRVNPVAPWRTIGRGGLTSIDIEIAADDVIVEPAVVAIAPDQDSCTTRATSGSRSLTLQVTPPSAAVALAVSGVPCRWLHGHVSLTPDDLAMGQLFVRTPRSARVSWLRATCSGATVQEIPPERGGDAGYRVFSLAGLVDTAVTMGTCDLTVDVDGALVRVARIEPTRIAESVTVEGTRIVLAGFTGGDVAVRVWSPLEAWQRPVEMRVDTEGRADLPAQMVGRGPLCVTWLRDDPWVWQEPSWLPDRDSFRLVDAPFNPEVASPAATALEAGATDVEPLEPQQAWPLLAMANRKDITELPWKTVRALTGGLSRDPQASLLALADTPADLVERLVLLIQSGVLWAKAEVSPSNDSLLSDDLLRAMVLRDPTSASLIVMPRLATVDSPGELSGTWATARATYGRELVEILSGRPDPSARQGGFRTARPLSALTHEQLAEILDGMRVVPKAILDGDARVKAAIALFKARHDRRLRRPMTGGRQFLSTIQEILRDWHYTDALDLIDARDDVDHGGGWVTLSAMSIGFALAARLGSRGDAPSVAFLNEHFGEWIALANVAPEHVAMDVVLAEAMTAAFTSNEAPDVASDDDGEEDE